MENFNSKQLFELLSQKLPDFEYLFFKWSGGGDDWSGFEFINGKNGAAVADTIPAQLDKETVEIMNQSTLFEELSLQINSTDQGWSEGVLFIALKPLTEMFEDDSIAYISQDEGFKGFAIAGKNHEEIGGSLDV